MESKVKFTSDYQDKIVRAFEELPNYRPGHGFFTDFEDQMLRKYYPTKDTEAIAKLLKKRVKQVQSRATFLKIKKEKPCARKC